MTPGLAEPRLPLWAVFVLAFVVVLVSIFVGYLLGARTERKAPPPEGPIGAAAGAMLGLLAFILAFTFGIASSRFDTRRQLLLDDVTALATAIRRSELLPEPQRIESRALLGRVVDLQLDAVRDPRKLPGAVLELEAVEDTLWAIAAPHGQTGGVLNSPVGGLYLQSLNTLEEIQTKRIAVALQFRIPASVWFGLLLVTVFAMGGIGFQFGIAGRGSLPVKIGLALAFAAVVMLIAQLDRTQQGGIQISQQPLLDLQRKLRETAP